MKQVARRQGNAHKPHQKQKNSCADVSKLESMTERSVQESENPKRSISGTSVLEDEFTKEAPVQENEEPKAKNDERKG